MKNKAIYFRFHYKHKQRPNNKAPTIWKFRKYPPDMLLRRYFLDELTSDQSPIITQQVYKDRYHSSLAKVNQKASVWSVPSCKNRFDGLRNHQLPGLMISLPQKTRLLRTFASELQSIFISFDIPDSFLNSSTLMSCPITGHSSNGTITWTINISTEKGLTIHVLCSYPELEGTNLWLHTRSKNYPSTLEKINPNLIGSWIIIPPIEISREMPVSEMQLFLRV